MGFGFGKLVILQPLGSFTDARLIQAFQSIEATQKKRGFLS